MYRKILIPLDGSSLAERVLAHVEQMFPPKKVEIYLLRVVTLYGYRDVLRPDMVAELAPPALDVDKLYEEAREYLRQKKGELREMGYTVYTHVTAGDVAATICEFADAQDVDLIAMTTHGYSGLTRWLIGSVADRVVRSAERPVLLVRPSMETPKETELRQILAPLDGSELAEQALPHALALAKENNASILLVQAILPLEELVLYMPLGAPEFLSDISIEELKQQAEKYLRQVQARLQEEGVTSEIVVVEGRPADVIIDVAEREGVGLIVMSTHGRSGLGRWVFGSVADKVLHSASRPLLLVRGAAGRGGQAPGEGSGEGSEEEKPQEGKPQA